MRADWSRDVDYGDLMGIAVVKKCKGGKRFAWRRKQFTNTGSKYKLEQNK